MSQASAVHELRASRYTSWILKRQRTQKSNCQHTLDLGESKGVSELKKKEKKTTSASLTHLQPLTVWITINWKTLKEIGVPDHLTCLLRNLHMGQETTVRTRHGTCDWFKIGKGVWEGCILTPCLFNLYTEWKWKSLSPVQLCGHSLEGLCWSWTSDTLATWCKEPTYWKRPWCWERLMAKGEEGGRG